MPPRVVAKPLHPSLPVKVPPKKPGTSAAAAAAPIAPPNDAAAATTARPPPPTTKPRRPAQAPAAPLAPTTTAGDGAAAQIKKHAADAENASRRAAVEAAMELSAPSNVRAFLPTLPSARQCLLDAVVKALRRQRCQHLAAAAADAAQATNEADNDTKKEIDKAAAAAAASELRALDEVRAARMTAQLSLQFRSFVARNAAGGVIVAGGCEPAPGGDHAASAAMTVLRIPGIAARERVPWEDICGIAALHDFLVDLRQRRELDRDGSDGAELELLAALSERIRRARFNYAVVVARPLTVEAVLHGEDRALAAQRRAAAEAARRQADAQKQQREQKALQKTQAVAQQKPTQKQPAAAIDVKEPTKKRNERESKKEELDPVAAQLAALSKKGVKVTRGCSAVENLLLYCMTRMPGGRRAVTHAASA